MTIRGFISSNTWIGKLALTVVVALVAALHWDVGATLFLGLLSASVVGLLDGRVSVALGLIGLACCPLLLVADQQAWLQRSSLVNYYAADLGLYDLSTATDQMAIWAFYFLCIGVVALIAQYVVRERQDSRSKKRSAANSPVAPDRGNAVESRSA